MKKLFVVLFAIFGLCCWSSCSEDFQVTAPYKNITFVYAFLNMKDTAHYIRIQKAFLDENKSAINMAQEADSNFYQNLTVTIREMSGKNILQNISLQKVDLTSEGYPKDSGAFFNSPSFAYKFIHNLNPNYSYRLIIFNPLDGNIDSSEVKVIDTSKIYLNISDSSKLKFEKTVPLNLNKYSLVVSNLPGSNIKYMESFIRFFWEEKNLNTGNVTRSQADLLLDSKATGSISQEVFTIYNQTFYNFLKDEIGPAPNDVERYLDSCDIYVYSGGADYYNYILAKTFHSGLTADQSQPIFSNIVGKDVYGLFSTKAVVAKLQVPIDKATMDSIMVNPITNPLRIKGVSSK